MIQLDERVVGVPRTLIVCLCVLVRCVHRFCEFPQEIVLAFDRICDIAQVQILSHQAKIAVKIEIFPGLALHGGPVADYKDVEYKRLGYARVCWCWRWGLDVAVGDGQAVIHFLSASQFDHVCTLQIPVAGCQRAIELEGT
jgi:hypothetical protein